MICNFTLWNPVLNQMNCLYNPWMEEFCQCPAVHLCIKYNVFLFQIQQLMPLPSPVNTIKPVQALWWRKLQNWRSAGSALLAANIYIYISLSQLKLLFGSLFICFSFSLAQTGAKKFYNIFRPFPIFKIWWVDRGNNTLWLNSVFLSSVPASLHQSAASFSRVWRDRFVL